MELTVRNLVRSEYSNIKFCQGTITGLVSSIDSERIEAVQYRPSCVDGNVTAPKAMSCSFFSDCSGTSRISAKLLPRATPQWSGAPRVDKYSSKTNYSGSIITLPPDINKQLRSSPTFNWERIGWIRAVLPIPGVDSRGFFFTKLDADKRTS